MSLYLSLPDKMPVQFETQTVAYTWTDLFAAAASNFNLSLTVLAFLFPWRQMFTPTHRDFTLAPLTNKCTGQQEQQSAAHGAAQSDADADDLELGAAAKSGAALPSEHASEHVHSSQLHERLLV